MYINSPVYGITIDGAEVKKQESLLIFQDSLLFMGFTLDFLEALAIDRTDCRD